MKENKCNKEWHIATKPLKFLLSKATDETVQKQNNIFKNVKISHLITE
jgi:hypothetical protein